MMSPERRLQLLAASRLGQSVVGGAVAQFGFNPDQARAADGKFGSGGAAGAAAPGDTGKAVADLYGRAGHKSVTEDQIKTATAGLSKLSKADVHKVATDIGMVVPKGRSKKAVVEGITQRLLDRKGAAIRATLVKRPAAPPAGDLGQRLADAEAKVSAAHPKPGKAAKSQAVPAAPKPPKAEKPAKAPKTPKAAPAPAPAAGGHAETARRIEAAITGAIDQMKAGTIKGAGSWGEDRLGDYDEAATHKVFDDALAAAKSKKDLVGLLSALRGGLGGAVDAKTERWLTARPRKELERHFKEYTSGRLGSFMRAHV